MQHSPKAWMCGKFQEPILFYRARYLWIQAAYDANLPNVGNLTLQMLFPTKCDLAFCFRDSTRATSTFEWLFEIIFDFCSSRRYCPTRSQPQYIGETPTRPQLAPPTVASPSTSAAFTRGCQYTPPIPTQYVGPQVIPRIFWDELI